ncbi:anti-sigma factor [Microbacterium esteraromaticum]|uniref:Regulator of SigK n=1 Tax=Microbacterium esteraromaticum TaxID=57043 RepID=A0A7D8ACG5_9MICO|nr:anti-sigma factor [Microbacterium esteraromaticum]QMU96043.1 anti-sigma factor [Microbacterium esteraromaticum]
MNEREFAELAAAHALGALSDADERRFTAALMEHPEWQAIADDDHDTVALLADGLTPVAPPPALRADLLQQIGALPQSTSPPPEQGEAAADTATEDDTRPAAAAQTADEPQPVRSPWRRRVFALAAGLALIVGAGIATTTIVSQLQRPASVVALDEIRSAPDAEQAKVQLDSGATATAHWSGEVGKAVLVASGLDDLDADRSYELWFVRGDEPIAAGVFRADDGKATALLEVPMQAGDVIAVTIEQAGGSPTGSPTSDPIIVIPTA